MSEDKKFVDGVWFNNPHPKAPDFVIGSISYKKDVFIEWLQKQTADENGYVKTDVKKAKTEGKNYMELNTWKKGDTADQSKNQSEEVIDEDSIPF